MERYIVVVQNSYAGANQEQMVKLFAGGLEVDEVFILKKWCNYAENMCLAESSCLTDSSCLTECPCLDMHLA